MANFVDSRFRWRKFICNFSIEENTQLGDGSEIYAADSDEVIGRVNNSAWSWGLQKTIGNASLTSNYRDAEFGRATADGHSIELRFSRKPLIDLPQRNQVPAPIS